MRLGLSQKLDEIIASDAGLLQEIKQGAGTYFAMQQILAPTASLPLCG
jgi:hypothetical protein